MAHGSGSAAGWNRELVIDKAEWTGEGETEGLTLRVRGFPDSAALGSYLAHGGLKTVPSEPGATQPAWWDLFFEGADAGIAYAPEGGVALIEIESSAALARALPLATIAGSRVELGGVPAPGALRGHLPPGYDATAATGSGAGATARLLRDGREVATIRQPPDAASRTTVVAEFSAPADAEAFHHQAVGHGYVAPGSDDIAALFLRYVTRHHRAAHESSHLRRNALLAVAGLIVLVALFPVTNSLTGGRFFGAFRAAAVRLGMIKEQPPAFVVADTGSMRSAGNIIAFGNVYLEFPERMAQAGDTVLVTLPRPEQGDRVYTAPNAKADSSGGIVQIIVARIVDAAGNPRYTHPAGAFPVPSYRMVPPDQWGEASDLSLLGADYVEALEKQVESTKRIRLAGTLRRDAATPEGRWVLESGGQRVVLAGPIDALTAVRLAQLEGREVDLSGNIMSILAGAMRSGKPTGEPMLEVNPQGVVARAG